MLAEKTFKNLEYHSCLIEASFSDSLNLVTIAAVFRHSTKYYVISWKAAKAMYKVSTTISTKQQW